MRHRQLLTYIPAAILASASLGYAQENSISAGEFRRLDAAHWASGTASVVETGDSGGISVLFESGFKAAPGPDLRVVLSKNPNPASGKDLGEYTELGLLSATEGSQSYEIPAGVSLESLGSVVIYCKAYDIIFSTATLAPAEPAE
ncbi:MAG: DM13 domain-containing protein [Gemmatimonadota bacterium]